MVNMELGGECNECGIEIIVWTMSWGLHCKQIWNMYEPVDWNEAIIFFMFISSL